MEEISHQQFETAWLPAVKLEPAVEEVSSSATAVVKSVVSDESSVKQEAIEDQIDGTEGGLYNNVENVEIPEEDAECTLLARTRTYQTFDKPSVSNSVVNLDMEGKEMMEDIRVFQIGGIIPHGHEDQHTTSLEETLHGSEGIYNQSADYMKINKDKVCMNQVSFRWPSVPKPSEGLLCYETQEYGSSNCKKSSTDINVSRIGVNPQKPLGHICSVCGLSYSRSSLLKEHMKSHEGKGYVCLICAKSFTLKYTLQNHARIHQGERHECNMCSKSYSRKHRLLEHLKSHEGVRYNCTVCGKSFAFEYTLKRHMMVHDFVGYSCSFCLKSFSRKDSLNEHTKSHDSRKYSCHVCTKSFVSKRFLKRHLKGHDDFLRT